LIVVAAVSSAVRAVATQALGRTISYSTGVFLIAMVLLVASLAWSVDHLKTDETPDPLNLLGLRIGYFGIGAQVPRFLAPRAALLACSAVALVVSLTIT
jgi:hypothetical protein